ncbi:immunoglobulin kappa light chain-like [Hemitrygon akajei]|uniref:immunoglobulin kappa light chain-like n=1 Tax=Hemitrygon akajei TaxID=2704970 RepID=UPI003BF96FBF
MLETSSPASSTTIATWKIRQTTSSNTSGFKIHPDKVAAQPTDLAPFLAPTLQTDEQASAINTRSLTRSRTMRWCAVFALSYFVQVCVSQVALFQSPPIQTVHVGGRAILNCSRDLGVLASINWYKRSDQRHLQFVCSVGKYVKAQGRFSGLVDEISATYSLVIENVQRKDSGIYFCADQFYGEFGNGSKLVVTEQPPTIFLLAPQADQIAQMQLVTLMCLVRGVSSHSLSIRWNISGHATEGRVDPPIFDPDGGYSVRSRFQIPVESWRSGTVCTCATGQLVSDSVSAQKDSLQLQLCHVLSIGLAATLVFLAVGATTVAIRKYRKERKPVKGETAGKSTTTRRKDRERDIYAQLAIATN